jgi:hypothetical protein
MTFEHLDTVLSFVVILTGVSLLVTTLTQMMSALLGLRGANLRWGIQTLLTELDPGLAGHAATISEKILHHPLISDSTLSRFDGRLLKRTKLASAIRKEELIEILRLLARPASIQGTPSPPKPEPWAAALRQSFDQLDPQAADRLLRAAPKIREALPDDPAVGERILAQLTGATEQLSADLNQWFDSTMDRVSQRFAMHARIWTILFSILVAFALHLDAFKLLTQLSTDAELRARLVASADTLAKKADEILAASPDGASPIYVTAMKQLISSHTNELKALPVPSGFTNLASGRQWLANQLQAARIGGTAQWLRRYEEQVPQAALRGAADDFHSILDDKLKFQLVPIPYPSPFYNYWTPSWMHFWGVLTSAALLSLGAPFWYNVLKSLSSLRPVVANKQKQESAIEREE